MLCVAVKTPVSLVDVFDKRKSFRILFDYGFAVDKLVFVYNAYKQFLVAVGISALRVYAGDGVMQTFYQFVFYRGGRSGNDDKLVRLLGAGDNSVAGKTADKTV